MNEIVEKLISKLNDNQPFILKIKVVAGAKNNSIEEFCDDIIKIKINKPAVDGKANKAIIEYLGKILDLPKKNIIIIMGEKNSIKSLRITPKSSIIQK